MKEGRGEKESEGVTEGRNGFNRVKMHTSQRMCRVNGKGTDVYMYMHSYTCVHICVIWRDREKSARGRGRKRWINVHIIQHTQSEMGRGRDGRRDLIYTNRQSEKAEERTKDNVHTCTPIYER